MRRLLPTVFVMVVFFSAMAGETQVQTKPVRVDAFGDALPPGALFRLGSPRWHHLGETSDLRFSEDGRSITTVGSDSGLAITFDIASGKETRRVKLARSEEMAFPRFSANGDRIWAIAEEHLLIFSATNGKLLLRIKGEINEAQFSRDGKKLMHLDEDGKLRHLDAGTGRLIKNVRLSPAAKGKWSSPQFSPNGKWLMAVDSDQREELRIWDADSGKQVHVLKKKGILANGSAFSPDGRYFAAVALDFSERPGLPVIIWDLVTGKEVRHLRVAYPKSAKSTSAIEVSLQFSADGNLLAYVEGFVDRETIWVWDVKTGKVRQQLKGKGFWRSGFFLLGPILPNPLVFSRDGTMLAAAGKSGAVLIWNLTTGKLVSPGDAEDFERALHYVNGGKRIVVGYSSAPARSARRATGVWDVGTGRRVQNFPGKVLADVSAAGNLLAVYDADSPETPNKKESPRKAEIVDLATGKIIWHSKLGSDPRFSRNGKKLAGFEQAVTVLDARTGKELSRLKLVGAHAISPDLRYAVRADLKQGNLRLLDLASGRQIWQTSELPSTELERHVILFSPDSELLALHDFDNNFSLWQTRTGKKLVRSEPDGRLLSFLPDCRTLLFQEGEDDEDDPPHVRTFRLSQKNPGMAFPGYSRTHPRVLGDLLEENRTEYQEFFDHVGPEWMTLTFQKDFGSIASADSKILVTAADPYQIQVWETATGKLLCRLQGERDGAQMPVLSPDCRTVTTRNANGTITVWDITGLRLAEQKGRLPASPAEFEQCWTSFADDRDGEKSFRAFWKLAADPDQTVTRLGSRLKPVPPGDSKRIRQLIAELGNQEFAVRARAEKELDREESALPILRRALEKELSLEARQRLNRIVEKLQAGPKRSPEALRAYRLVQLLEQIGSMAARDLLRTLSRGAQGAMLTTEARTALERLGGSSKNGPDSETQKTFPRRQRK